MTLAGLGQMLAAGFPVAGHLAEPDDYTKHSARWWRRRLAWPGRSSPGQAGRPTVARHADPVTRVRLAPGPPAPSAGSALLQANRMGSPASPMTWPATMPKAMPDMTAHLLGELNVAFQDHPVGTWASGRGRAVFEYLLVNRHSKVRRDRLMSVFWPEVSPDAARNSLNVAIHGLRQSLRAAAGDVAVVIHRDQAYLIEPALDIWVDVEVFGEQMKAARQHLATAEPVKAEPYLEAATLLYQGEFLAGDPYEEWAIVMRENLRLCYLEALDQLGELRLNSGNYVGCVAVCLKLLACDNCREDAHCRLMRCYSRQGQVQLALRQYHSCAAALRTELDVAPSPGMTELFKCLRRREAI
jgi:DNA-binding SARP family transcriptional activator